jgi:methylmalonyl-CoA/ethylmalonyl-CoA epimerase
VRLRRGVPLGDLAPGEVPAYTHGMIGKLNHVGVATPSIEKAVEVYRDMLGATQIGEKFALPEQGVWVCFVDVPNSQIELIEPYGDNSPLKGFLEKNPAGGQHHICFEVPDIIAARDDMVAKGATVLNGGVPRIGAHKAPVIFVHPKNMGGVLVELMETPKAAH